MPKGKRGKTYVLKTRKKGTKGGAKGTTYRDYSKRAKAKSAARKRKHK